MLEERGVAVDRTTIYRWVQAYAPEIERRLRWHCRRGGLSGERDVSGEITRTGDVALRSALFQAATTALARRMGVVLLRMWRDGTEFRFTREPATAPDPA